MLCFFLMNLACILHNRCIQVASQRCVCIQLASSRCTNELVSVWGCDLCVWLVQDVYIITCYVYKSPQRCLCKHTPTVRCLLLYDERVGVRCCIHLTALLYTPILCVGVYTYTLADGRKGVYTVIHLSGV